MQNVETSVQVDRCSTGVGSSDRHMYRRPVNCRVGSGTGICRVGSGRARSPVGSGQVGYEVASGRVGFEGKIVGSGRVWVFVPDGDHY